MIAPPPHREDLRIDVARLEEMIEGGEERLRRRRRDDRRRAGQRFKVAQAALQAGDWATARQKFTAVGEILDRGAETSAAAQRLLRLIEAKRKLVDTYAKTRPLTQRVFTVAEVNNFIAAFKQEVDRAVMDQSVRRQIFDGVIAAVPPNGTHG